MRRNGLGRTRSASLGGHQKAFEVVAAVVTWWWENIIKRHLTWPLAPKVVVGQIKAYFGFWKGVFDRSGLGPAR